MLALNMKEPVELENPEELVKPLYLEELELDLALEGVDFETTICNDDLKLFRL